MGYTLNQNKTKHFLLLCCVVWIAGLSVLSGQTEKNDYQPFLFSLEVDDVLKTAPDPKKEVVAIVTAQKLEGDSLLQEVRYWNAAYPSYRWHQIMVEAGSRTKGHKNGGRMAILHLAIYDALAEVWKYKQEKER